ncbi:MAG: M3 family oligoendopeptidase [Rhodospirillales bacterium]|nr:M3 family oligoendopeptidase [Rhodospirillales bacterium]
MSEAATLGDLPEWDLSVFYDGSDDPRIDADMVRLTDESGAFERAFKGRLADLGATEFATAIRRYEAIEDGLGRVGSYAQLHFAGNQSDPERAQFYQGVVERLNDITGRLIFFTLEINRIDDDAMERLLTDKGVARYRPWLENVRSFRPHQLSDEAEEMLHELSVVQTQAWIRLFDQTIAGLRFEIDGETMTEAQALDLLSSTDGTKRRAAALELGRVFRNNEQLFAHITNTLAKSKAIDDGWRSFVHPMSSRNLANQVEDKVVEALIEAVREAYPRLSHRYYRMKARWFEQDQLPWWDRNAPLPNDDDREIPWSDARSLVLDAYGDFAPKMAEIADVFFEKNWIDAPVREGKAGGAFSHPTVPSAHPFVLLNYQGKVRDVMTLAHELGHGVHQVLAAGQGPLLADTPLTLAETASVFGEQLAFRRMLDGEDDEGRRRTILAGKVEDMLNTVVRQIAFCEFERRVHNARRDGELTPEQIGDLWMGVQTESLGDAFTFDDDYRIFWCYIPHFIHSPFYVYAYAFGDCLVNALYAHYREAEEGFQDRFLDMLQAGGTKRHKELLAPFGLDASDPAFWSKGLGVIEGFIDELEAAGG